MEDDRGENLPTIPTELVETASAFEDVFETPYPRAASAPMRSVEIDISGLATAGPGERRAEDGLIREVTVPLTLSLEELRAHQRLKLRIQLELNLIP